MKKVGRQVLFLETSKKNPRNGEGSFVRLADGKIMFVFTQYYGDSWGDNAIARLAATYSSDDGETWSEPSCLMEKDENAMNIMSLSLIRLKNGKIGLLYLRKSLDNGGVVCLPFFCTSSDEGKTFSKPVCCVSEYEYFVVNNDRIIQLRSGRIIFPIADHGKETSRFEGGKIRFSYSDDCGESWHLTEVKLRSPYRDKTELQEPGIFELDDGRLWAYVRTAYGHQYQSFSSDNGVTWSHVAPNFYFTSPDSPMLVKRVNDRVISIFNPVGFSCLSELKEKWGSPKRTPYVCAVSFDGGLSFDSSGKSFSNGEMSNFVDNCVLLEDDTTNSYCYPSVIETNDGFLVAYYHSNGSDVCLNSTKIIKVTWREVQEAIDKTK